MEMGDLMITIMSFSSPSVFGTDYLIEKLMHLLYLKVSVVVMIWTKTIEFIY